MILLLSGTAEGREIAQGLASAGLAATASFAGVVPGTDTGALPARVGGFGGGVGFRQFLDQAGIRAVIDATHPFAARITARTAAICAERGLPLLRVDRPEWRAGPGDTWHSIAAPEDVVRLIPEGARVFLAVGRNEAARYAGLGGRAVVLRSVTAPEGIPGDWEVIRARPPFTVAQEQALLRDRSIDWLVTKNAGGQASEAKLIAARRLGIPVAMIARAPLPSGIAVTPDAAGAVRWAAAL